MTLVGASVSVFSLRKEMAVPPVPVIVPALMIVLLLLAVIPTPPVTDAPVSMLIVLLLLSARMPLPVVPPVTDAPVKILMMSLLPSRKMPLRVSVTDTGLTVILRLFASAKKPSGLFWLFTTLIQVTDVLLYGVPGRHAFCCESVVGIWSCRFI